MLHNRFNMNESDKLRLVEVAGKTMLGLEMCYSIWDIAKSVNLEPYQVEHNIDEYLHLIRKHVGWKRYIKALFIK